MRRRSRALASLGADLGIAAKLISPVTAFLRHPLTLEDARAELARRRGRRERDFLALMQGAVCTDNLLAHGLQHAGCEHGDLERLVDQDGVEGALRRLRRVGVYLTVDEAKRRCPVVRGGLTVPWTPDALSNPLAARHVPVATSGSRGAGTPLADGPRVHP